MSKNSDCRVKAYCDTDCVACPDSWKSVIGYTVLLEDSPVSWKSKKKEIVSWLSAEAEYRSLRKVVGELVWLSRLFDELYIPFPSSIDVCDSQSAIQIATNPVFREWTKHIEVDCHFVRTKLQEGLIALHHVTTVNQLADILTKALRGVSHLCILNKLAVRSSLPTWGGCWSIQVLIA